MSTPTGVSVEGKPAAPASVPTAQSAPAAAAPAVEVQAPKELRQQLKAANKAAREAQEALTKQSALLEQLKAADPRELTKAQREAEAARNELAAKEAALGKYTGLFETMYNQELESLPEAVRENVKALSVNGDWPERLEAMRAAKGLMGSQTPQTPPGTPHLNPARQTPQMPTNEVKTVADLYKNRPSLSSSFKTHLDSLKAK